MKENICGQCYGEEDDDDDDIPAALAATSPPLLVLAVGAGCREHHCSRSQSERRAWKKRRCDALLLSSTAEAKQIYI